MEGDRFYLAGMKWFGESMLDFGELHLTGGRQ